MYEVTSMSTAGLDMKRRQHRRDVKANGTLCINSLCITVPMGKKKKST